MSRVTLKFLLLTNASISFSVNRFISAARSAPLPSRAPDVTREIETLFESQPFRFWSKVLAPIRLADGA